MTKTLAAPRSAIICLPDARLRTSSQKVGIITDQVRQTAETMQNAMLDWEDHRQHEIGVALAAVQLGIPLRLVVVRDNFDNKDERGFQVLINPVITKYEGEITQDFEGCLSVPDIYGHVPRHTKVRLRAINLEGRPVRFSAEGFLARVLQHEVDHTNGMVFIDRIKDNEQAFYCLAEDGKLKRLDYEKDVRDNRLLWQ